MDKNKNIQKRGSSGLEHSNVIGSDVLRELSYNDGHTFQSIVENLPEVFFVLGLDGTINYLNPAFTKVAGWSLNDWIGKSFLDLVLPEDIEYAKSVLLQFVNGNELSPIELRFMHRDGRVLIGEVSAVIHRNGSKILSIVGMVHDITAQKKAQEDLLKSKNRLELMSNIAAAINSSASLDSIIENTVDKISAFFKDFRINYSTIDGNYRMRCLYSRQPADMKSIEGQEFDLSIYMDYIQALKSKKVIRSNDISKDNWSGYFQEILANIDTKALVDVPIFDSKGLAAIVCLDSPKPYEWTEYEIETLKEASETLSLAIKKAQADDERMEYEKSLNSTLKDLSTKNKYESIISSVTRSVHKSIDPQEVFERTLDAMMENIEPAQNMSIYMVEGKDAVLKAYRGYTGILIERILTIPYPIGVTWKTINEGKTSYIPDVDTDNTLGKTGRDMGVKSLISMPIKSEGVTVGCIHIVSFEKDAFSKEEVSLLERIAQQLEAAIKNAKQAEALRESEERYRALFDQSPVGVYIFDNDLKVTNCNKQTSEIINVPQENIIGFDIKTRSDSKIYDIIQNVLKGHNGFYEGFCELTQSSPKPYVYVRLTPLKDEKNNVVGGMAVVEDISQKKQAQDKLALQEKRIKSLYEISAEPSMGIDRQILETIKAGCDMLGMDIGIIGSIAGNSYTVLHCYDKGGSITQGASFELDKIYCNITLQNDDVLALDHVGCSEYKEFYCYKELKLESYIAVPLRVKGKIFGTLNFSSLEPRAVAFTNSDKEFIRLMGRWVSTMIEKNQADHSLMVQEQRIRSLYEISADSSATGEEQIMETLRTGASITGHDIAGISQHSENGCSVLYSVDPSGKLKAGYNFELGQTLCSIPFQTDELLAIEHVALSEYKDHVGYERFKIESLLSVPIKVNGKIFGSLYFASETPRETPFSNEDKDFVRLMGRWVSTMIERMKSDVMLSDKEELYRTLVENAHDLIVESKVDGTLVYLNSNHKNLLGYDNSDLLGKSVFDYIHQDDIAPVTAEFMRALMSNTAANAVFRFKHKNGEWRWLESTGKSFKTSNGEARWVIDSRDVTERKLTDEQIKKSLKEKESLLREIHHRVKNNLQVISSLLSLQSDFSNGDDPSTLFDESQNRISTIALIHEQLYQSEDLAEIKMGEYIGNLTANLLSVYGDDGEGVDVQFHTADINVDIDTAIPCGLILNELFSNCLKHAFNRTTNKDNGCNQITVGFNYDSDGQFVLCVSDNGCGLPENIDFRDTESLGLQLVCTLTDQLGGKIELNSSEGTRFEISFPNSTN